jgi:hypothetical protein
MNNLARVYNAPQCGSLIHKVLSNHKLRSLKLLVVLQTLLEAHST